MEVEKKPSATLWKFIVNNIQGIEVLEYEFKNGVWVLVTYGKNGSGKSSTTTGIYLALGGKKAPPGRNDNFVGPYSTKAVKKGTVDLFIDAEPGATELGEKLWVRFGITEKGTVSLKVTDTESGEVHTTSVRDKVKALFGMFLDPVEMVKKLDEFEGDKRLAEQICAMVGLDLIPFVETEAKLFAEFQDENKEKTRQENALLSLDEPQENWAKKYTNPAEISEQLQKFNLLKSDNEQRKRNIIAEEEEVDRLCQSSLELYEDIAAIKIEGQALKGVYNNQVLSHNSAKESLVELQEKNKPVEWTGTKNIQAEIQKLTEELGKFQIHEQEETRKKQEIDSSTQEINLSAERLVTSKNEISSKKETMDSKITEKKSKDTAVNDQYKKIELVKTENVEKPWEGEKDPEGNLEPEEYLNGKMNNVTKWNTEFASREAYEKAEKGLEAVKASILSIEKKRADNKRAKSMAVASVKEKFPHPGITVDENTVWVDLDDRKGKRTINDLSTGEQLAICTHILIAGNTGPLKLLIIRDGALLDSDNRQIIYDITKKHGYKVVLEAIETSEAGALHIVDGRVDSINQPLIEEKPVVLKAVDSDLKPEKKEVPDSDFNWD